MTIPADTRCLGLLPTPEGVQRCTRRNTCARYMERHSERAPVAQYLCPTLDEFWGAYIEVADAVQE